MALYKFYFYLGLHGGFSLFHLVFLFSSTTNVGKLFSVDIKAVSEVSFYISILFLFHLLFFVLGWLDQETYY